ncbi:MAG: 6,7-dimethyl-8-ribityllumazine synthase, partial [Euryarchaeota archaeon]|nr:6,7-dimethyl-8-ribityllumazine synthase [Euryarchaeota archaeon]
AEFNAPIPDKMLAAAEARAKELGATVVAVVRVPGTWEIPVALRSLLRRRDVDAAVALGAIVTGETKHDELIGDAVARALMDFQLETGKPVGLGISGPGMTWEQAEARVGNAARAVEAAVQMARSRRPPARKRSRR